MTTAGPRVDVQDLYARALDRFGTVVHGIADDRWVAPSPCSEWDVRTVVNHMTGENLWTVPLFDGATVADVGGRFDGDVLGDDPVGAWDESAAAALGAVESAGAMTRTVHLSFGDFPGSEYAMQLFADLLIHGWDVARGTGQDDRLDPELVDACAEWFADRAAAYREFGVVGATPDVAVGANPQTRLLAQFGRVSAG